VAEDKSFSEQWCCTWVVALTGDWSSAQDGVRWEAWSGGSATLQVQRRGQIVHGQICVPAFLALLCQLLPSLDAAEHDNVDGFYVCRGISLAELYLFTSP